MAKEGSDITVWLCSEGEVGRSERQTVLWLRHCQLRCQLPFRPHPPAEGPICTGPNCHGNQSRLLCISPYISVFCFLPTSFVDLEEQGRVFVLKISFPVWILNLWHACELNANTPLFAHKTFADRQVRPSIMRLLLVLQVFGHALGDTGQNVGCAYCDACRTKHRSHLTVIYNLDRCNKLDLSTLEANLQGARQVMWGDLPARRKHSCHRSERLRGEF